TSLIAAVLSLAIAAQVLLRPRRRRVHWLFGLFGLSVGFWYLSTVFERTVGGPFWPRVNHVWAVVLPLAGAQFFRAFAADDTRRLTVLHRIALACAFVMMV